MPLKGCLLGVHQYLDCSINTYLNEPYNRAITPEFKRNKPSKSKWPALGFINYPFIYYPHSKLF